MENRRWYNRKGSHFSVKIFSPFDAVGIVLNASDGGLLISLDGSPAAYGLKEGADVELIVTTEDPNRLLPQQKIQGEVTRVDIDQDNGKILVAVEVIGAWEDLIGCP
jgi:hypothetical protein